MLQFTHLLTEAKSKYSSNLKPYAKTHDVLEVIEGFAGISFNYNMIPPIRIKTKPSIFILKRKEGVYKPPENYEPYVPLQLDEEEIFEDSKELPYIIKPVEEKEIINTSVQEDDTKHSEEEEIDRENDTNNNNKIKENIKNIIQEYKTNSDIIEMAQNNDELPQNYIKQKNDDEVSQNDDVNDVFRAKEAVRKLMKEKREIKLKIEELQQQIKQDEIARKNVKSTDIISTPKVVKENHTIADTTEKKSVKISQKIPQKVPPNKNDSLLIKTSIEGEIRDQDQKEITKPQPIADNKFVQNKSDVISSPVNKKINVATASKNKTAAVKKQNTDRDDSFTHPVNERVLSTSKDNEEVRRESQVVEDSTTDQKEKDHESTNKINESSSNVVNEQIENNDFE